MAIIIIMFSNERQDSKVSLDRFTVSGVQKLNILELFKDQSLALINV